MIVVEDTNSGFDFFKTAYQNTKVISSKGKDNVWRVLEKLSDGNIVLAVDGAAFGSNLPKVMEVMSKKKGDVLLIAKESFEFVVLSSQVIGRKSRAIEGFEYSIDSSKFFRGGLILHGC